MIRFWTAFLPLVGLRGVTLFTTVFSAGRYRIGFYGMLNCSARLFHCTIVLLPSFGRWESWISKLSSHGYKRGLLIGVFWVA
ncbi:hypothetical protein BGZ60DRAFT_264802 [Tricladium varicosporioides]|nr:hypothetical protein BGZ60DRAFT_264802 [Hymenoscyphus varicosporioides]